jgi:hypothetical protein
MRDGRAFDPVAQRWLEREFCWLLHNPQVVTMKFEHISEQLL